MSDTPSGSAAGAPRRWSIASSLTAAVSAVAASACCIGPIVLAAFGIGGAGVIAKLSAYRPWFIALTVVLLASGFFAAYRPRKPSAEAPDCACGPPATRRLARIVLWLAAILAVAAVAFPHVANRLATPSGACGDGCCAAPSSGR